MGQNAVLPIMVASLLAEGESLIENVPDLKMKSMCICLSLELTYKTGDNRLKICSDNIKSVIAPYEVVSRMRAFLVMGATGTFWEGRIALPGGCRIGNRPIDLI